MIDEQSSGMLNSAPSRCRPTPETPAVPPEVTLVPPLLIEPPRESSPPFAAVALVVHRGLRSNRSNHRSRPCLRWRAAFASAAVLAAVVVPLRSHPRRAGSAVALVFVGIEVIEAQRADCRKRARDAERQACETSNAKHEFASLTRDRERSVIKDGRSRTHPDRAFGSPPYRHWLLSAGSGDPAVPSCTHWCPRRSRSRCPLPRSRTQSPVAVLVVGQVFASSRVAVAVPTQGRLVERDARHVKAGAVLDGRRDVGVVVDRHFDRG